MKIVDKYKYIETENYELKSKLTNVFSLQTL